MAHVSRTSLTPLRNQQIRGPSPSVGAGRSAGTDRHARRVRDRETGEDTRVLGLMVSGACEAYSRVVPRSPAPPPEPASPSVASAPDEVGNGELAGFRIRVKQSAGPRTRILALSAESDEEARALAATHLGDEWEVLEILTA